MGCYKQGFICRSLCRKRFLCQLILLVLNPSFIPHASLEKERGNWSQVCRCSKGLSGFTPHKEVDVVLAAEAHRLWVGEQVSQQRVESAPKGSRWLYPSCIFMGEHLEKPRVYLCGVCMLQAVNKLVQLFAGLEHSIHALPSQEVSTEQMDERAPSVSLEVLPHKIKAGKHLAPAADWTLSRWFTNGKRTLVWLNSSNEKHRQWQRSWLQEVGHCAWRKQTCSPSSSRQ